MTLLAKASLFLSETIFDVKESSPFSIWWRFEWKKIHRILLCEFAGMIP
jgi:hypothetical protein